MSVNAEETPYLEEGFDDAFEERADHVDEQILKEGTATGDHTDEVVRQLLAKGLVLLVGPRGCGKTHLMRYAWLSATADKTKPFCIYTSLNRYLSLEPWSRTRTDVTALFHSWTLARILEAATEAYKRATDKDFDLAAAIGLAEVDLGKLVNTLERNFELDETDEQLHRSLSVETVSTIVRSMAKEAGRKRVVIFLDDAALTLSSAFMSEFLDILRVLKASDIAPKCSIYPGTTVFGQRFHADHEGRTVSAWVPVTDPNYRSMMQTIAERRYPEGLAALSADANALLQYAAFGIPRAYLTLLRTVKNDSSGSPLQATLTKVIRGHRDNRISEYRSLGDKAVELRTLVRAGETLFDSVVDGVKEANGKLSDKKTKQALVGIQDEEFNPLSERMMDLLTEAGLLYRETLYRTVRRDNIGASLLISQV